MENRLLFSKISVADFGAHPDDGRDDRAAIQAAINASQPGDEIAFDVGTYQSDGALTFKSSRTYAAKRGTQLDFSNTNFGVHIEGSGHDITITRFIFNGAGIDMGMTGDSYRHINIVGNAFHDISTNAIKATMPSDHLSIDGNEFVNVRGYGVFEIYSADHFSYTYNHVIDSRHGGHLLAPLNDNVLAHNYMTGLTDWGLEIQRNGGSVSHNLLVEDNVIFGFKRAYGNSGGLSVIAEHGINTIVRGNYIRADHGGVPLEEGHMHVGIEAGFDSGEVSGNVIGGDKSDGNFTHYITASGPNMLFKDNQFFGTPQWNLETAQWAGDQPGGHGTFRDQGNSRNHDYAKMPKPPKRLKSLDNPDIQTPTEQIPTPTPIPEPTSTPVEAPDNAVWLSDLRWTSAQNGWGPVETDQSNGERKPRDGQQLTINGKTYAKGLGVAVNSEILYNLDGQYSTFFSDIGIDDYSGKKGSATFEVWVDGDKVYDSGKMMHTTNARSVSIDVSGAQSLKLVTTDAGDGGNSDHSDWAGARLQLADAADAS